MKLVPLLFSLIMFAGCTDACIGKVRVYNDAARVTCYSGARLTFDDCSTGKVESQNQSDGYFFIAKGTQRPVEISGNCNILYNEPCPEGKDIIHN